MARVRACYSVKFETGRNLAKKDIEIQPGFEPGSSEFRSDALTN